MLVIFVHAVIESFVVGLLFYYNKVVNDYIKCTNLYLVIKETTKSKKAIFEYERQYRMKSEAFYKRK